MRLLIQDELRKGGEFSFLKKDVLLRVYKTKRSRDRTLKSGYNLNKAQLIRFMFKKS